MRNYFIPAISIVIVTIIIVLINEFTELSTLKNYAFLFIVAAMLLGIGIARFTGKASEKE